MWWASVAESHDVGFHTIGHSGLIEMVSEFGVEGALTYVRLHYTRDLLRRACIGRQLLWEIDVIPRQKPYSN